MKWHHQHIRRWRKKKWNYYDGKIASHHLKCILILPFLQMIMAAVWTNFRRRSTDVHGQSQGGQGDETSTTLLVFHLHSWWQHQWGRTTKSTVKGWAIFHQLHTTHFRMHGENRWLSYHPPGQISSSGYISIEISTFEHLLAGGIVIIVTSGRTKSGIKSTLGTMYESSSPNQD